MDLEFTEFVTRITELCQSQGWRVELCNPTTFRTELRQVTYVRVVIVDPNGIAYGTGSGLIRDVERRIAQHFDCDILDFRF